MKLISVEDRLLETLVLIWIAILGVPTAVMLTVAVYGMAWDMFNRLL